MCIYPVQCMTRSRQPPNTNTKPVICLFSDPEMRRVIVVRKNTLTTLASSSSSSSTSVTTTKVPRNTQCSKQQLALLPSTQSRPPSSGQPSDAQLAPFHLTLYPGKKRCRPRRLPRPYQLDTGAYGIPKHPSSSTSSVAFLPHTKLSVQVGEDAYFTRPTSLGIADGVGGWTRRPCPSSQPSPSALFSRRLMHFCSSLLSTNAHLHPSQILQQAYAHTLSAHSPLSTGSSTALLAVLDHDHSIEPLVHPSSLSENYAAGCIPSASSPSPDTDLPQLHIAHLGDSMAMLIRDGRIIWRTAEMWSSYNHPLQLAPGPSSPQPHTYTLPVHPNDIFILASDGLSDNLWDDDILDEVIKFTRSFHFPSSGSHEPTTPSPIISLLHSTPPIQILSEALCSRAKRVASSSSSAPTPASSTSISGSSPASNPQSTSVAAAAASSTPIVTELGPTPATPTDNLKADITPGTSSTSTPFAYRAKLAGKPFRGGGKPDGAFFLAGPIDPN